VLSNIPQTRTKAVTPLVAHSRIVTLRNISRRTCPDFSPNLTSRDFYLQMLDTSRLLKNGVRLFFCRVNWLTLHYVRLWKRLSGTVFQQPARGLNKRSWEFDAPATRTGRVEPDRSDRLRHPGRQHPGRSVQAPSAMVRSRHGHPRGRFLRPGAGCPARGHPRNPKRPLPPRFVHDYVA